MKKLSAIILTLFLVLAMAISVSGLTQISLSTPTDASWSDSSTIYYNFTVTGNSSTYNCAVYDTHTGTWAVTTAQNSSVSNNTATTISLASVDDSSSNSFTAYDWNVNCEILGTSENNFTGTNFTYYVDTVNPVITVTSPTNLGWYSGTITPRFNFTVVEDNTSTCILYTVMNETSNSTSSWFTANTTTYTNNTNLQLDYGDDSIWAENGNGTYYYTWACTDLAGNMATVGNYSVLIDRTDPSSFNCTGPTNNTRWTDFTPTFIWSATTELNFSRYTLYINDTSSTATDYTFNISSAATNYYTLNLDETDDATYHWYVEAYDEAGNTATATTCSGLSGSLPYIYKTDATCSILYTGWNMCAMVRDGNISAATIGTETSATYVSMYNSTHSFQTHIVGTAGNAGMQFAQNQSEEGVVFIYVAAQTNWENRTWETNITQTTNFVNISNTTSAWNVFPIIAGQGMGTTFGQVDFAFNGNGSHVLYTNYTNFVMLNYSDSDLPFIGHTNNFTVWDSDDIPIEYGNAIWVYYGGIVTTHTFNTTNLYG